MQVLIVSQYFYPENFSINDVAGTLLEKGIEVEVLTGKPNYPCGEIFAGYRAWGCQQDTHRGININRIPILPRGRGGWWLALNYLSFILAGLLFAPWMLRKKRFDVIFIYAPSPILQAIPAIFLGWLKRCPVVLWVQDLWPESLSATGYVRNRAVLKLVERVVRFIYRHVDLLLVQSRAFEGPVCALASGTPIEYCPNSVGDTFAISATNETPSVEGLGEGFSVMFAGNIGAAQAVGVIVEAASFLREYVDIHFVVLGDGSSRESMLKEVRQRGLTNLHLPGRFPVETMPGFMQKASVLLVTLADQPIFAATVPNKVQAYMAAGKPIIACLNGEGARLVVEAKAGLAIPAEDSMALADAILYLYKHSPEERAKMGENGRRYYQEHFAHDRLIDQLIRQLCRVSQSEKDIP
ncbi:glycosyltransferase family 4 protein [Thiovibrio frasassiensis]|uniref:Glycosyltransferase family 4 protein n=1 Tax=Thiovibrio frasassiensis TaxID=2984131 RepID=A0A9X4MHP3_9BACT|nr:glycosyltransferase family 4 protein [Thiovibrio frasassiensis]MDG4476050.1 glycosyltransferase family 4 protein [Thiovibrio frasassiensis]